MADAGMNMRGFTGSLSTMYKEGAKTANSIEQRYQRIGGKMQSVGRSMTMSLTAPLVAMGAASVKAFATFDSEMTKSLAIMGGVSKEMRSQMKTAAMSVSEDLNIASSKAAESFFFLASAGLDAKQSVAALPQVAEFAKAGMFDMATATDLATDAQSALGLTVDDAAGNMRNMARVTDVLVKANTLANASVQQFSEALTNRAAAALRSANKEVEEGVAVLSAFADQGMKGQMAGEQLARILRILSQEAAKNSALFKDLGLIDAQGNLASMSDIIEVISNEMKGLSDAAKSAKLEQLGFTARVQAAIKPLLGTSDAIRQYKSQLEDAGGITEKVADKQMKSFSNQLGVTWQMIKNAGIEIGELLAPAIRGLNKVVSSAIKGWRGLSNTTKGITLAVGGLVAAAWPLIAGIGTLVTFMPVLTAGFLALTSPISLTIAAVAGLAAAASYLYSNWDAVKDSFNRIFISMKNSVALFVAESIAVLNEFFGRLPGMQQLFGGAEQWARSFIEQLPDKEDAIEFKGFGESMGDTLSSVMGMFGGAKAKAVNDAKAIAEAGKRAAQQAKKLAGGVKSLGGGGEMVNPFAGDDNPMQQATAGLKRFKSQVTLTKDQYKAGMNQIKSTSTEGGSIAEAAFAKTSQAMDQASQAGQRMGNAIGNALSQAVLHGKNLIDTVKNLVKQFASRLFVKGITMLISGGFSGGFSFGKLFKGLFHTGGIVPGTGKQPIIAKGGEGVFTKGQMAAMGNLQSRSSGSAISQSGMQKAFENALASKMSKLGPDEIFAMTQQGSRGY